MEKVRAVLAAAVTGAAVFWLSKLLPADPESIVIDNVYVCGILAGVVACIFGRSRRGAFFAAAFGVLGADMAQGIINWNAGLDQPVNLGGGGAFDAVMVAVLLAVFLTEFIGEMIERGVRTHAKRRADK